MEKMVCKIKCERVGCEYEEEVPAPKVFGGLFKKPPIPKDWGVLFKVASVKASVFNTESILLCPKCFKEALEMQQQFLNKKNVKQFKSKSEKSKKE